MNPEHKTIFEVLKATRGHGKLWHRISLEGFRNVIKCREIHTNLDNRYEVTYDQSRYSLARHYQSLSLFDFDSSTVEEIINQECNWMCFIKDFDPITIILGVERKLLNSENIIEPWSVPLEDLLLRCGTEGLPPHIPYVEVLHKAPIPTAHITEVLLVKRWSGFEFKRVPFDENVLSEAMELAKTWTLEIEQEYKNRNSFDIEDLLPIEQRSNFLKSD